MGRTSDARERLTDAILHLMWEGSYGTVTIDDICKKADVKKGSFYHFFESKVDLAIAAVDSLWVGEWQPVLDKLFSPTVEPLARIYNYLQYAYERQKELKETTGSVLGCPLCSVGSEVSTKEPRLSAKIREIYALKRRYWESALRDASAAGVIEPCDPVKKAACLAALVEGAASQARILNDTEPLRTLPQTAVDMLRAKAAVSL